MSVMELELSLVLSSLLYHHKTAQTSKRGGKRRTENMSVKENLQCALIPNCEDKYHTYQPHVDTSQAKNLFSQLNPLLESGGFHLTKFVASKQNILTSVLDWDCAPKKQHICI